MNSRSLIGAQEWNPIGETLWSITAKLAILNHFDWSDFKRNFGTRKSYASDYISDISTYPDDVRNFNVKRILQLTGWKSDWLEASCGEYYSSNIKNICAYKSTISINNPLNLSKHLRICPQCVQRGTHLVFHQILAWSHCPIHHAPLTTICIKCGSYLHKYKVTNAFLQIYSCPNIKCGTNFWDIDRYRVGTDILERKKIIEEYRYWINKAEELNNPSNSVRIWLKGCVDYANLAYLHHFSAGPDWVKTCLVNVGNVRTSKTTYLKSKINIPTREFYPLSCDVGCFDKYDVKNYKEILRDRTLTKEYLNGKNLIERFPKLRTYNHLTQFITSFIKSFDQELKVHIDYSSRKSGTMFHCNKFCSVKLSKATSLWCTAYSLWQKCVFPQGQIINVEDYASHYLDSSVWMDWSENGPGKLLWSEDSKCMHFNNRPFVYRFTKEWLWQYLAELYLQFVWLVSLSEQIWVHSDNLERDLNKLNFAKTLSFIDITNNKIVYEHLTFLPILVNLSDVKQKGRDEIVERSMHVHGSF